MKELTWRDVLDCKTAPGTSLSEFLDIVKISGYDFFAWNGKICFYDRDNNIASDTHIPVKVLEDEQ